MSHTGFWLIRHALVEENARAMLYGTMDVELCPHSLEAEKPTYAALARRLPRPAQWRIMQLVHPASPVRQQIYGRLHRQRLKRFGQNALRPLVQHQPRHLVRSRIVT